MVQLYTMCVYLKEERVQKFGCFTEDLHNLAQWLKKCKVTTVAMESTGVYWIPLFQILESYKFEVKCTAYKECTW